MLVPLAIVFTLLWGTRCESSGHQINNAISKDQHTEVDTAARVRMFNDTRTPENPEPAANPENAYTEETQSSRMNSPLKITMPLSHNKNMLTKIIHPIPQTMLDMLPQGLFYPTSLDNKIAHDFFLYHEIPVLLKKLQQFYAAEELRQKRKDLKEKWRRYKKLMTLHDTNEDEFKVAANQYFMENKDRVDSDFENNRQKRANTNMQDQPHTSRLLEHRHDDTLVENSSHIHEQKIKQPTPMETHSNTVATLSLGNENIDSHSTARGPPRQEIHAEFTTESHFNPANYVYGPYIPMMPAMYWPTGGSTTESSSS